MADSTNPRSHRTLDASLGSDGDRRGGGTDPLAELARLIGQNDPFAEFERKRAHGEAHDGDPRPPAPQDDWPAAEPPPEEPYAHGAGALAPHQYSEEYAAGPYPAYQDQQAYGYAADPDQEGYQAYYDPYYDPEAGLDEAEYLEQQERRRRRMRWAVVAAILALAIVGGAGAYGYRTLFGTAAQPSPPPVIKADATPTKVIPAAQAGDAGSNKLIYDRVGESGTGQAEKVVPREEKPIDIKTATVTQPPRIAYPAPDASLVGAPPATIAVTGQNPGGQVLPVASEPSIAARGSGAILPSAKKVRTLTIRPDMTVAPPAAARTPEPEPPASASAEPAVAPRPAPPAQAAAPKPPPNPPPPARVTQPPAPPPQQAVGAPLSLSPEAPPRAGQPAPPAPARQPMALASAPASEPATASAGGRFTVQVSSQRSEAEAQAAYRTLQARYPSILGGQSSFIRKADLGSRGVYYRTLVGPFATAAQAGQLCSSLKAAGGQCIIHRN